MKKILMSKILTHIPYSVSVYSENSKFCHILIDNKKWRKIDKKSSTNRIATLLEYIFNLIYT